VDDREREALAARMRRDLEAEYARAEERRSRRQARKDEAAARAAEEAAIRGEVTETFWTEKGYVRYVDSRGRERWLPKAEAERRLRRRAAEGESSLNLRPVLVYGALVAGAVVAGVVIGSC
jgi:hypothetical protein